MDFKKAKFYLKIRKIISEILILLLGSALMAAATSFFLLPNQLSSGGFAGIGTITYYLFGLPVGIVMLALNIPLFIAGFFTKGKLFFLKSVIGTISLAIFIDVFDKWNAVTADRLLSCIYGGILMGVGTALVLKSNGSTGGTDLLSYIIRKYNPKYRSGSIIILVDTIIIVANVLVFQEIEIGLYSVITIYLMGKMIDIVFEGVYFTKMLYIISDAYQEIAEEITKEIGRGVTSLYAKGMYTGEEKNVLLCVASRGEIVQIKQIVHTIDAKAFMVITNAREALGKGFKETK